MPIRNAVYAVWALLALVAAIAGCQGCAVGEAWFEVIHAQEVPE